MERPEKLICASLAICEQVLQEQDGVNSLIRQVDIYYVRILSDVDADKQVVRITAYFSAKFNDSDGSKYELSFDIVKPDGSVAPVGKPWMAELQSKIILRPEIPRGITAVLIVGVKVTALGVYLLRGYVNGVEVARAPFSIIQAELESKSDTE